MGNTDGTSTLLVRASSPPVLYPSHDATRLNPSPPTAIIAAVLDACSDVREDFPLSRAVLQEGKSLDEAMEGLPLYRRSLLSRNLEAGTLSELQSLAGESDPEIFLSSLLSLGRRLRNEGREPVAAAVFQIASQSLDSMPNWRARLGAGLVATARREWQTARGQGPLGARLEGLLRRLGRESTDPSMLIGFAAGAAAFQSFRFLSLARLTSAPAGFLTRNWGARALAAVAGVGAETVAMSLSARGVREALGAGQAWDLHSLGRDFLSTGITLGLMRSSGFLAEGAFRRVHRLEAAGMTAATAPLLTRVSRGLFPQAAMFGALVASNRIEAGRGLRPRTDAATTLVDSLATLLQFNVGARLFHAVQPEGFAAWNRAMELRVRDLSSLSSGISPRGFPPLAPRPVFSVGYEGGGADGKAELGFAMMERPEDSEVRPLLPSDRPASETTSNPTLYKEVFENAPQPILVTDAEGDIRYANREARGIFRPTLLQMANIRLVEWFQPHPTEAQHFIWDRGENGVTHWKMESRPVSGQEGLAAHFLTDITELQLLKAEAARLRETNARLEASSELSQRFSHDEGNLLAALALQEKVLERSVREATTKPGETDAPPNSSLQKIDTDLKELSHTLDDVVGLFNTWKRVSRGQQRIVSLAVPDLLSEALRLNEGLRTKSRIQLVTDYGTEVQVIQGDEALLLSSVLNLCVNACHAMPQGGVLTVRSYAQGSESVIEVSDNGTGIAPEHLSQVFDLGFTTKEHAGGTGIGLPSVKATIENLHGGRIEMQSSVGVGTSFRLYFPLPGGGH